MVPIAETAYGCEAPEPPDDRRGSNQPKSRASWRKGPATATANQPAWSTSQWSKVDPGVHRGVLERRFKLAALLVILALLSTGYAYYVFYAPVKAPLLTVVLHHFDSPLVSPNSWALEDAQRFADSPGNLAVQSVTLDELANQVKKQPTGGPNRNVVVVYLSGQGVVDENSEPCLIDPATVDPINSQKWLRLEGLLKAVCDARPEARTKKLVLLDCGRIDSDWSLGVLKNDFCGARCRSGSTSQMPGTTVIASAGPGQRSHDAPELGGSVFGCFAARLVRRGRWRSRRRSQAARIEKLPTSERRPLGDRAPSGDAARPELLSSTDGQVDFAIAYTSQESFGKPAKFELAADPKWNDVAAFWN